MASRSHFFSCIKPFWAQQVSSGLWKGRYDNIYTAAGDCGRRRTGHNSAAALSWSGLESAEASRRCFGSNCLDLQTICAGLLRWPRDWDCHTLRHAPQLSQSALVSDNVEYNEQDSDRKPKIFLIFLLVLGWIVFCVLKLWTILVTAVRLQSLGMSNKCQPPFTLNVILDQRVN